MWSLTKATAGIYPPLPLLQEEKLTKKLAKPKTAAADFSAYDVIFIGFPVWYSTAPQFVQDYIKASNLSGKRVIPFVTTGASGKMLYIDLIFQK